MQFAHFLTTQVHFAKKEGSLLVWRDSFRLEPTTTAPAAELHSQNQNSTSALLPVHPVAFLPSVRFRNSPLLLYDLLLQVRRQTEVVGILEDNSAIEAEKRELSCEEVIEVQKEKLLTSWQERKFLVLCASGQLELMWEEIEQCYKVQSIVNNIKSHILRRLGHVERMESHRAPKKMLNVKPKGRRSKVAGGNSN
ncbi:hypothetical protein C0J52_01933 [Blattella germanica]|nr:hypothetical protein C0J52_01933 [Blattella germanica]